jgi:hypothetical protein
MLALVRSTKPGLMQSWSHDGGIHWSHVVPSLVDGAAAKPALASYTTEKGNVALVLAWVSVTEH